MTFSKLAWRNFRNHFGTYLSYLLSQAFSVMVFYVFMAIYENRQFFQLSQQDTKVMAAFQTSAVVVALFSIVFVWYSNGFFVRSRTKELGTYALLGMERQQIAWLLFLENGAMGLLSLVLGIALGSLFSQLCARLLIQMVHSTASVSFAPVPQAITWTIALFAGLLLVTSLHTSSLVYRLQLIDLFQAGHQGERVPGASVWSAVLGILFIAAGYVMADAAGSMLVVVAALPILLLTITGTYLVFRSVIPAVIRAVRHDRRLYYRGTRMISTSQLLYRIRGNVSTLATIAVLTAVTVTASGTTFTFYLGGHDVAGAMSPFSFSYIQQDRELDTKVQSIIDQHPELHAAPVMSVPYLQVPISCDRKASSVGLLRTSLGDSAAVIARSEYDAAARAQGHALSPVIEDGQCAVVTSQTVRNDDYLSIRVAGSVLEPLKQTVLPVVGQQQARSMLVVSDAVYAELMRKNAGSRETVQGYMVTRPETTQAVAEALEKAIPSSACFTSYVTFSDMWFGEFGIIAFIGLFLGLVFVFATGSIISFKQLMEAREERERYTVLRDIGVSRREVWEVVARQMAVIFGLPLLVGIAHSTAALFALRNLLGMNILPYCALVVAVYVALYSVYYVVTVRGYVGTVA